MRALLLLFSFLSIIGLHAFELPIVEIKPTTKPEIIIFKAESIIVNNQASYKLIWKTANATKVTITFIGNIELSGSLIITQNEYNRGEIILKASNNDSDFIATQTLNSNSAQNKSTPMRQDTNEDDFNQQQYYNSRQYYPGGVRNPMNRNLRRRY